MHIFVKDDPYHSGLGLVDSQLKNFVLAFIEAPTLYKVRRYGYMGVQTVSYTHLDVYKRQGKCPSAFFMFIGLV